MRQPWRLGVMSIVLCLMIGIPGGPAAANAQYELWPSCTTLPDFAEVEFLPIFTPSEPPAFVDLGSLTVQHAGKTWKALQFTRDKSLDATVSVNKWLFGLAGDEWPAGTVDVFKELHAGRLESVDIDGKSVKVNPSCLLDLSSQDGSFAVYVVLLKFTSPGVHTLKYRWRQRRAFYFVYPFDVLNIPDPAELNGRRVFLGGETVGDPVDGDLVLNYNVTVTP